MPHKGSRKERHADFWDGIVTVVPCASVEDVHETPLAREHSDGNPAPENLAVGREIGPDAEIGLRAAGVAAEPGDDFVENESDSRVGRQRAEFVHEIARLKRRVARLHGFHEDGGKLVRMCPDDFERLGAPVFEDQHVLHEIRGNTGGDWLRAVIVPDPRTTGEHLIEHSRVIPGEIDDATTAGRRSREAEGRHDSLGAGVAEGDALHSGEFGNEPRHLSRERILGTNFDAATQLLLKIRDQPVGRMPEKYAPNPIVTSRYSLPSISQIFDPLDRSETIG